MDSAVLHPFVLLAFLGVPTLKLPAETAKTGDVFFEIKVLPVLTARCFECHSHDKKIKGGLVWDSRSGWAEGGVSGPALVAGKPEESLMIHAIRYEDEDTQMPPKKKLSDEEIAVLVEWVKMGAPDPRTQARKSGSDLDEGRKHWAFQKVTNPEIPALPPSSKKDQIPPGRPIDAFIRVKLAENHLVPAALADRATLLRRATYDLTGLPPTAEQTTAFVNDPRSEEASFAAVIERLLASPAYGEKWGRFWLDLVHYADTTGCSSDWPIDDMWRYRDWVIGAFNEDTPFDEFLTLQLAGDLVAADMAKQKKNTNENAYKDAIIATGFLATAKRFGSDPGGYDYLTIADSIDTTSKALQGLTLGCARCHDHKFDPLKASDYYSYYGILASSLFPYAGSEKNVETPLLVPLDSPIMGDEVLDAWNRQLPSPFPQQKRTDAARSVLSSYSPRWSFEDNETSEPVMDRKPINPWVTEGGLAVRDGNSPFTHLFPLGAKLVGFQATDKKGQMARRVRWSHEVAPIRSFSIDFQCADLWDPAHHSLKLAWHPRGDASQEIVLATVHGRGLIVPGGGAATPLVQGVWHHLSFAYAMDSGVFHIGLWNQKGELLFTTDPVVRTLSSAVRDQGDLVVRFEADETNDQRRACVRIDNIVAEAAPLYRPVPSAIAQVPAKLEASAAEEAAVDPAPAPPPPPAADAMVAAQKAIYDAVLPLKPATAFAMWEGTPHDVPIQKRGEPENPGAIVPRRNLLILGGEAVKHPQVESGRRDLARWMLDDSNPLTLRVFVNRLWQWHFGLGIVATPNDFGHKGQPPTHPELLDFLVQRFRANKLSVKAIHREIMLSHAYRQSSTPSADARRRDPENRWLSRFSPRRLTAEELRDSVLLIADKLDPTGRGYRQPFPPFNGREWSQHRPFSLFTFEPKYAEYEHRRRSIYLPVVRLSGDPFLSTFDVADSNQSVATRDETAVPLQALALLNAPFLIQSANRIAELALQRPSDPDALGFVYHRVFGVQASEPMMSRLVVHVDRMTREKSMTRKDALAVVAQSLFDSNAFLYVF